MQQQDVEIAERAARNAAQSGDAYDELLAEGAWYGSQLDWRRSARAAREAIALRPDRPDAYFNLGAGLANSGHYVEAAQRYLDQGARAGGLGDVGTGRGTGLQHAHTGGLRRGGQAGVVE